MFHRQIVDEENSRSHCTFDFVLEAVEELRVHFLTFLLTGTLILGLPAKDGNVLFSSHDSQLDFIIILAVVFGIILSAASKVHDDWRIKKTSSFFQREKALLSPTQPVVICHSPLNVSEAVQNVEEPLCSFVRLTLLLGSCFFQES